MRNPNHFRTHSLVLLRYHDDPTLPVGPLIAKVKSQISHEPPFWIETEILHIKDNVPIRGNDCDVLTPPKGCAKPLLCCTFDSPSQFADAIKSIQPKTKDQVRIEPNTLYFPLGSQPLLLAPKLYGGRFSLITPPLDISL